MLLLSRQLGFLHGRRPLLGKSLKVVFTYKNAYGILCNVFTLPLALQAADKMDSLDIKPLPPTLTRPQSIFVF